MNQHDERTRPRPHRPPGRVARRRPLPRRPVTKPMTTSDENRPVWDAAFDETTRQAQMDDDSAAWHAVTGLLLAIISGGLILAMFTAWMCS